MAHDSSLAMEHTNIVSHVFSSAKYDPEKPVLIDAAEPDRWLSKGMAEQLVASLTGVFEADSTVCLHIPNDILYPILCYAIWASKCRWTGTNVAYKAPELEHHFRASATKYVITAPEYVETVRAAVDQSGTEAEIIIFTDILDSHLRAPDCRQGPDELLGGNAYRRLHEIKRSASVEALHEALKGIKPDSIASLMSTSGTTGRPKMAARTHRAMIAETKASMEDHEAKGYEVRRLYCTPIFHAFSTPEMVINCLRSGIPSYFMKRFDDKAFPQKVAEFRITETFAPPPMILRLIDQVECHASLQSLRAIYSGGAPLAQELYNRLMSIFPPRALRLIQVWGMTEGGWFTTFKHPEVDESHSCGRPLPGFEVKMSAEDQSQLDSGQKVGQLYFRAPSLMKCYYQNPEATAETFDQGGWLKTGDIGYVKDGKVYLVDRSKDLIKVNGWQVSPAELEDALLVSQHIRDCGVIGVGQGIDEHPLAFVVLADEGKDVITPDMIKKHLRSRLVSYKVSCTEIQFVETIPKSVAGKILRNELRKLAAI